MGIKVIEKHFILDKSLGGPDVEFSADVNEFRQYIVDIRNAEKALGSHEVAISNKIKIQKENFGRKLFFVNSKDRNEEITEADIKSLQRVVQRSIQNITKILLVQPLLRVFKLVTQSSGKI